MSATLNKVAARTGQVRAAVARTSDHERGLARHDGSKTRTHCLMGASNAMAAVTYWAHLPGESFKVLTYMALITLDRDPEPTYWGSTEALIEALGRKGEPTHSDYRALRRAIRPLVENGAVSVDKRAAPGRPPAYRLHLTQDTKCPSLEG